MGLALCDARRGCVVDEERLGIGDAAQGQAIEVDAEPGDLVKSSKLAVTTWRSRDADAHQASLELPSVQDAITQAQPIIAGMSERVEFVPQGGLGLPTGA